MTQKIVTCDYCAQKINVMAMEDEPLWACVACGGPLPDLIEEYQPNLHGSLVIQGLWQPYDDQFRYEISDGTSGTSWSHTVSGDDLSAAVLNSEGLTIGYQPGEQPSMGDMFYDSQNSQMNVYVGDKWVQVENGQSSDWQRATKKLTCGCVGICEGHTHADVGEAVQFLSDLMSKEEYMGGPVDTESAN